MADPHTPGRAHAWLWVLGGLAIVLAIALVVVLVTDDDTDDAATSTTTTSTTVTSTSTTTTTAAPTTTVAPTTTTVTLPIITDDPQSYAEYLFAAWQNNDQTAAAEVASAEAVTQMFARPFPAQGPYTFASCGPAAGSLYCTWNGQNGATIRMTVRTLTGGLPVQVRMVQFSP